MRIEAASEKHLSAYRQYFQACRELDFDYYRDLADDADAWLRKLVRHADGEEMPAGWVPCQIWFLLTPEGEIVGAARLRHGETHMIQEKIGHIGFEVLPKWRGNGYGRVLLQYVQAIAEQPECGNWVVVCDAANAAAVRTVETCGGQLLEDVRQADGTVLKRYSLTPIGGLFA
ncbi:GNAT family N-acetyltransferase [Chromobacterium amazonense]|uniref:GNAT family N-acetyltransferase n=1 Tax=Chromobacterium amazonense TaxID=1382803 RepID=UPI0031F641DA